uniref:LisH domain-containing protein n=1 Tax=Panagrolaimus sp. JU765 TaxID=591449 RepID=A0AC34RTK1_9BILA
MAEILDEDAKKVVEEFEKCGKTYRPNFTKQESMLQTLVSELIDEPMQAYLEKKTRNEDVEEPQLTVMAQYLFEQNVLKLQKTMDDLVQEHRSMHKLVSRCGKNLDKNFERDLTGLLRNEKDIEGNVANKQRINELIHDFLLEKGMVDVASTLQQESELPIPSGKEESTQEIQFVMDRYRSRDLLPVIDTLQDPIYRDRADWDQVLFNLHKQQMLLLLEQGKDVVRFGKKIQCFGDQFPKEISHLMGAVVNYPNVEPRYSYLFHPNNWQVLESQIIKLMSGTDSALETLLTVGAKAMPPMLSIKNLFTQSNIMTTDELPVSINIPNPVHSTFTCPILKTQSSEANPPYRLGCGHVISKDAITKLCSARPPARTARTRMRNTLMKCPYCPHETDVTENKRLFFN